MCAAEVTDSTGRPDLYLGIDVGTQGTKAVLIGDGRILARASRSYGLLEGLPTGAAEQHPDTWVEAVRDSIADVLGGRDAGSITALGVSGQQHGFVPLGEDGSVLRPAKLWCDSTTSAQAAELSAALGSHVPTGFTASKILWMRQREPELFSRLRHVLLPHDYLNYRLTGEISMEPGDASGTGLFDVAAQCFDRRASDAIDPELHACLPALKQPGELAGLVDAQGAKTFGLAEGTAVSTGGGDNMMSAIGSGAVREGVVVLSLGTSGTVFSYADQPVLDPRGWIASFCGSAGGWLPLLCVMNLTAVTGEVQAAFDLDHAELTARSADVPPGCGGLRWLPFLSGERVPDLPDATGTLLGMRPGCLSPALLYRAAIEGTSYNLAWGMDLMRDLGVVIQELRLVGGASQNQLWRRILADVCELPVRVLLEPESGALGAALQAMWAHDRHQGVGRTIHEVLEPFVQLEDAVTEPGPAAPTYSAHRAQFAADLRDHYGVE